MTVEEAEQFVEMISAAWPFPLTETQKVLWRDMVGTQDANAAFTVIVRMFKTEKSRPEPPVYLQAYRRQRADDTPVAPSSPQGRDEMPAWMRGWRLARERGDMRAWPEQRSGYERLGYLWQEDQVMPQADRVKYMRDAGVEL